jgi:hypothetical protein
MTHTRDERIPFNCDERQFTVSRILGSGSVSQVGNTSDPSV